MINYIICCVFPKYGTSLQLNIHFTNMVTHCTNNWHQLDDKLLMKPCAMFVEQTSASVSLKSWGHLVIF